MSLLPWLKESFYSPLSQVELLTRVQNNIISPPSLRTLSDEPLAYFGGYIAADSFTIEPLVRGVNGYLPLVTGRVEPSQHEQKGVRLTLRYRMKTFGLALSSIGIVVMGIGLVGTILGAVEKKEFNLGILATAIALIFGTWTTLSNFWQGVRRSQEFLTHLLSLQKMLTK